MKLNIIHAETIAEILLTFSVMPANIDNHKSDASIQNWEDVQVIRDFFEKHFNKKVFSKQQFEVKLDAKTLGVLYRKVRQALNEGLFCEMSHQEDKELLCGDLIHQLDKLLVQQQQEYLELSS